MTRQFKSLMRAQRRGHVHFETRVSKGKMYLDGVYRRAPLCGALENNGLYIGKIVKLPNGQPQRFLRYGL